MSLEGFRGRTFVVKIGGELIGRGRLGAVAEGIRTLRDAGVHVVLVHGGGPQASELSARLGLQTRKVGGRRVTDEGVLQVMKQALAGEASVDLAAELRREGVAAVALHGVSAGLVTGRKRPPAVVAGGPAEPVDFGFVGDVESVNVGLLRLLCEGGYVPALASVAGDAEGGVWNINADTVAREVAAALGADKLLLVAGVPGVLRSLSDPSSRLPRLDPAEAQRLIEEGVVTDGMIAKVEEALAALAGGVGAVHLCGDGPGQMLEEIEQPGSVGTVFTA